MITRDDLQLMKERLGNLSLDLLPDIVLRDFPRLIQEVEALQAIVFISQFNGVADETSEHEGGDAGVPPQGVVGSEGSEPVQGEHSVHASRTKESKPIRAQTKGSSSKRRANRKRRRRNKK
jgi:hypothetical protein